MTRAPTGAGPYRPAPTDIAGLVRAARALLVEVTELVERARHLGAEATHRSAEPVMASAEARFATAWAHLDQAIAARPQVPLPAEPVMSPRVLILGRRRYRYFQVLPKVRISLTKAQVDYDVNHPGLEHAFAVASVLAAVA